MATPLFLQCIVPLHTYFMVTKHAYGLAYGTVHVHAAFYNGVTVAKQKNPISHSMHT